MKHILVATDFSESSERALMVAHRFAQGLGAAIELVHIYPITAPTAVSSIPGFVPLPPPEHEVLAGIGRRLDEIAAPIRASGVECLTFSSVGNAADEIVAHADRIVADFIVVGTHGRTGIRRVLLGSVAEQVLRKAHRPVLAVPPPRESLKSL